MNEKTDAVLPARSLECRILLLRGQRVMLSHDLAALYVVETRALVQAVKRNIERFPADFMFQIDEQEARLLKSQSVISSWGGARRSRPYAFTQEGVAMLSGVLRSPQAVRANIEIMRAFVKLRRMLQENEQLARKMEALEKRCDAQFKVVLGAIRSMMAPPTKPPRAIGFKVEERAGRYRR